MVRVTKDVPFGNACDLLVAEGEGTAAVSFAADAHGGPERLWFCFRVEGIEAVREIHLILKHAETMLGGSDPTAMRPVIRWDGSDWERLGAGARVGQPDGQYGVAWTVAAAGGAFDIAFCYPYGTGDVEALVADAGGYWKSDAIGVTQAGSPIVRLANDYGSPGGQRQGLYLIARQHSGETPGSWVLDGLMRELAQSGAEAPLVWCVPLANTDGVARGDYGKDNFPYDLNRAWGTPPMRHEVLALQRDARRWQERCRPALMLDFHAPGGSERAGMYGFLPDPAVYPAYHREAERWAEAMQSALGPEYAAQAFATVPNYPSRWTTPSATRWFGLEFGVAAVGLETPYALIGERVFTRADYREAGARLMRGIAATLTRR